MVDSFGGGGEAKSKALLETRRKKRSDMTAGQALPPWVATSSLKWETDKTDTVLEEEGQKGKKHQRMRVALRLPCFEKHPKDKFGQERRNPKAKTTKNSEGRAKTKKKREEAHGRQGKGRGHELSTGHRNREAVWVQKEGQTLI